MVFIFEEDAKTAARKAEDKAFLQTVIRAWAKECVERAVASVALRPDAVL